MTDRKIEKRLLDLERQVRRLENEISKASYCYYTAQQKSFEKKRGHLFNFKFEVHSFTYLKVNVKIETQCESYRLSIKINDSNAYSVKIENGQNEINCLLPFCKGVNAVTVILSADSDFTVENCFLETFGNLSYVESGSVLQVINESSKSIILSLVNETVSISEYENGNMTLKFSEDNVKSATICKLDESYLLTIVDMNCNSTFLLFGSAMSVNKIAPFESEIMSVCSLSGTNATVLAVKGNSIYKYYIDDDLNYQKLHTGLKGKEVKANPQVSDYVIVVDYNNEAKLVRL